MAMTQQEGDCARWCGVDKYLQALLSGKRRQPTSIERTFYSRRRLLQAGAPADCWVARMLWPNPLSDIVSMKMLSSTGAGDLYSWHVCKLPPISIRQVPAAIGAPHWR